MLNYILAGLLILSYLSVHVSPDKIPFLALLGLFFPFLIIANFLFLLFRIYKKKAHFFISLIALLLGINHITDFFGFNNKEIPSKSENSLKIMTYNVRMFDLYNWSNIENAGNNILDIIKTEDADIICLQEFFSNRKNNRKKQIKKIQATKDYIISSKNKRSLFGNAIFSKFPIINHGYIDVGYENDKNIFADIVINKDTIRVYNIHLASIHLNRNDYKFMNKIDLKDKEKNIEGVKGIGAKLLSAYRIRSGEVDAVASHIKNTSYKTIICGDFNDTPVSYTYRKLKGNLKDAFIEAGFGIGNTYAGNLPFFRIDYVFHSSEFSSVKYTRIKENLSDHFPVITKIEW